MQGQTAPVDQTAPVGEIPPVGQVLEEMLVGVSHPLARDVQCGASDANDHKGHGEDEFGPEG